ncbi:MAG: hypothetical protein JRI45_12000 [Deltaproteobacteria bacterium]|nr:hypothetical protein [Deltaproteobacteria bacterium]
MKLIRMRIKRTSTAEKTHYDYPSCYDAKKVKFGPIYEGAMDENVALINQRNQGDEFIVIGTSDEDAAEFLKAEGSQEQDFEFGAKEITEEEALVDGNKWTKQREKIIDEQKVIGILAKVARDKPLTQREKNALDPDNPEPGINKSRSFGEGLNEFLGK